MPFACDCCSWLQRWCAKDNDSPLRCLFVESGYHLVRRLMVKRRKSTVPPPPAGWSLHQCMRLLAGAWTADVIWYLRGGKRCFTELQTDIKGVSPKMLTSRLRKLERDGVIERFGRPTSPPTVWYALR